MDPKMHLFHVVCFCNRNGRRGVYVAAPDARSAMTAAESEANGDGGSYVALECKLEHEDIVVAR